MDLTRGQQYGTKHWIQSNVVRKLKTKKLEKQMY